MAISFVGSLPTVGANNGGNVTLTFSNLRDAAGSAVTLLEGDIVVCAYSSSGTADLAMSTSSSGWTEVTEVYANGTLDTNLAVYWKIMTATPDTSFVAVGPGGASNGTIGVAFAFRGQHATTPFSIAATTATGTGTSVPNAASITPTTAGSWPIVIGAGTAAAGAVFSHTDLSATTNHFRSGNHAETNDIAIGFGIKTDWSSGAFDPAVWTGGNVNASNSWATISLVLEPAPSVFTVSVTAATINFTEQPVTVNAQRLASITAATVSSTAQTLTASVRTSIAVTAASLATSGAVIGVNAKRMIAVSAASLTATGQTVFMFINRRIETLSATIQLIGRETAVSVGGPLGGIIGKIRIGLGINP